MSPGAIAPATGVVVAVELVMLRLATRTAVHIPGLDTLQGPVAVLAEVGRLSYYLAVVLVALVLLIVVAGRGPRPELRIRAAAALALVAALAAGLGTSPPLVAAGFLTASLAAASAAPGRRPRVPPLVAVAALMVGAATTLVPVGDPATALPRVAALLRVAEVLAVTAALLSPLTVFGRQRIPPHPRSLVAAAATAGVVTAATVAAPSAVAILSLWAFGLPGSLPAVAYGVAAGAVALTVVEALRRGQVYTAWGWLLLTAGGVVLTSTYQSSLTVAGLVLLAGTVAEAGEPATSPVPPAVAVS